MAKHSNLVLQYRTEFFQRSNFYKFDFHSLTFLINAFILSCLIFLLWFIKNTQFFKIVNQISKFNNKIINPKHVVFIMIFLEKHSNLFFEFQCPVESLLHEIASALHTIVQKWLLTELTRISSHSFANNLIAMDDFLRNF